MMILCVGVPTKFTNQLSQSHLDGFFAAVTEVFEILHY